MSARWSHYISKRLPKPSERSERQRILVSLMKRLYVAEDWNSDWVVARPKNPSCPKLHISPDGIIRVGENRRDSQLAPEKFRRSLLRETPNDPA